MKFAALWLAGLAGLASATIMDAPTRVVVETHIIEKRDLQTIQGVISTVSASMSALNAAATAFSGNDIGPLQDASNALADAISSGTTAVQGTSNLSVNDAVSLQGASASLQTEAQNVVTNLAAKKDVIQQIGGCEAVRQQSETLNSNSQALINAVVSKVPTEVQSIAQQVVGGFTGMLAQNSANFAVGNCTDAAGVSTISASGPTATGGSSGQTTASITGAAGSTASSQPVSAAAGTALNAMTLLMGLVLTALLL